MLDPMFILFLVWQWIQSKHTVPYFGNEMVAYRALFLTQSSVFYNRVY